MNGRNAFLFQPKVWTDKNKEKKIQLLHIQIPEKEMNMSVFFFLSYAKQKYFITICYTYIKHGILSFFFPLK